MKFSADQHCPFGKTGLHVPPIMFGTDALGDVRRVIPGQTKLAICGEWFRHVAPPLFIETAVEYGDGMALAVLRRAFERLEIAPEEVVIGLKLQWKEDRINYRGVFESWETACRLLGGRHLPRLVSMDAVDEYLFAAKSPAEREKRFHDILDACLALDELKAAGKVAGIGVGARDWRIIREMDRATQLDWMTLAGSFTVMRHPPELFQFMSNLAEREIAIVHSSVFHSGFLVGEPQFDDQVVNGNDPAHSSLLAWRKAFTALCHGHGVRPAAACIQFCLSAPGAVAVVIDTSYPDRVAMNVESVVAAVPDAFWASMKEEGLLAEDYPYFG